jgi:hypothetical protein
VCGYNSRQSATAAAAVGNSEIPLHGKQGTESSKRERAESFLYIFFYSIHKGAAWGKLACQWPQPGHTIERLNTQQAPIDRKYTIGETENAEKKRKMHQRASLSICGMEMQGSVVCDVAHSSLPFLVSYQIVASCPLSFSISTRGLRYTHNSVYHHNTSMYKWSKIRRR